MNLKENNPFSPDKVKLCNGDVCIEARGDNAKLIVSALVITLLVVAFIKAS